MPLPSQFKQWVDSYFPLHPPAIKEIDSLLEFPFSFQAMSLSEVNDRFSPRHKSVQEELRSSQVRLTDVDDVSP